MMTPAQRQTLDACKDWSAPFEVMFRRHDLTGEIVDPRGQRQILGRLRTLGLVEYGMCNDTWRITETGRQALGSAS